MERPMLWQLIVVGTGVALGLTGGGIELYLEWTLNVRLITHNGFPIPNIMLTLALLMALVVFHPLMFFSPALHRQYKITAVIVWGLYLYACFAYLRCLSYQVISGINLSPPDTYSMYLWTLIGIWVWGSYFHKEVNKGKTSTAPKGDIGVAPTGEVS